MAFKDRLKEIRADKGFTITQLAAQINKGESAVRMWEIGRSNPDLDTLIKLANYFDCTTDYLLGISNTRNEIRTKESDEFIDSIKEQLVSLDEVRAHYFKRIITGILRIVRQKNISHDMSTKLMNDIDRLLYRLYKIIDSMATAHCKARLNDLSNDYNRYSIMRDVNTAYDMKLQMQNIISQISKTTITFPLIKIKKILEDAGYDADYIADTEWSAGVFNRLYKFRPYKEYYMAEEADNHDPQE